MTELSGGVVSLLNKRRRACLGVECQIVGDAVAYIGTGFSSGILAEAYKLSYNIVGSLPLAKNAKHSPSIIPGDCSSHHNEQKKLSLCL